VNLTSKTRIRRFSPLQRIFHTLLMISFLVQGATGLSRMYMETPWGKWLGTIFGGYEAARVLHIYIGIFMICGFLVHTLYLLFLVDWKKFPAGMLGPDSLLPRSMDLKHFFQHIGWFLGMRPPPKFDRWGYWEKFDFWAVFWGMVIIGTTGMLLAYPVAASRNMPGWGLNVAFWVHRIEALLAMAHVFIIHFFIGHLRRHNFPMDRAMFEGSASLDVVSHEKPAWIQRLRENGELESALVVAAAPARQVLFYVFGYAAVAAGLFLLIGALVNTPYITW
jgi:cytochrome b subunit of formate dehydrogenase